jgi:hypothetical protein
VRLLTFQHPRRIRHLLQQNRKVKLQCGIVWRSARPSGSFLPILLRTGKFCLHAHVFAYLQPKKLHPGLPCYSIVSSKAETTYPITSSMRKDIRTAMRPFQRKINYYVNQLELYSRNGLGLVHGTVLPHQQ